VSRLLLRALVHLYPADWRERYGEEYDALLEAHGADLRTLADVAAGAVDARLGGGRTATPGRRQRSALVACLWAAVAMTACVAGFQKMVEYDDFRSAASRHAPVAAGRDLILAGGLIVAAAACLAGLMVVAALWRDLRRAPRAALVRPLLAAAAATLAFFLGLAALVAYAHEAPGYPVHGRETTAVLAAWFLYSCACVVLALSAAGRLLSRLSLGPAALRWTMRLAWVAAAGMALTVAGLAAWGIALRLESAPLFDLRDGGLLATPTPATWGADLLVAVAALALALAALGRAVLPFRQTDLVGRP
jgi:hypothetical protein